MIWINLKKERTNKKKKKHLQKTFGMIGAIG